ncbi:twin-arginine translocation signal domain-containing protein [Halosimplex litoreum]|uniref:Twin-arginine translocation signal domain-containing protein n=1 Tax=Halosimplex litoreum TaxID=1198301 RepID=A0A7T3FW20_9EURY|nr:twin-arginine translocation signal domain-containing protein [Halosimplex litoreum]QPV61552.1 twin-arginine translocation signal domain-containing protein [Halosimplex litoreum]
MTGTERSRRRFLKGGLAVAAAGLAGCSGGNSAGTATPESVFRDTSVSGNSLRVTLREDHDVSTVNLIDSSGSIFQSSQVATGATTVELGLFDYRRGWHYTPGEHTLVAVEDGEEVGSTTIPLTPELEITNVEPYTGGRPTPSNRANLLVTVENTGTGPTWVYYVGYENAPRSAANRIPTTDYARSTPLLNLEKPQSADDVILQPGDSTVFRGIRSPLLLSKDDHCNGLEVNLTAIVSTGIGENGQRELRAVLDGEPVRANFRGTCSDIQIEPREASDPDE